MLHEAWPTLTFSPFSAAAPAIVRRDPEIRPITAITCHPPAGRTTICVRSLAVLALLVYGRRKAELLAILQNSDGVWTEFVPVSSQPPCLMYRLIVTHLASPARDNATH